MQSDNICVFYGHELNTHCYLVDQIGYYVVDISEYFVIVKVIQLDVLHIGNHAKI